MKISHTPKTFVIDAGGKILGRVATVATEALRGKNDPNFERHEMSGNTVIVLNMKDIQLSGNKLEAKEYFHHTRYPGGLRRTTAKEIMEKNPSDLMRRAVHGMLPKNKLRERFMKNLLILNDDAYQKTKNDIELKA
ncbi:MAG: 50S ribosomal protein L13 [Patescibacteria group bacterium]